MAKIAADHQNARGEPATPACGAGVGVAALPAMKPLVALAASVLSSAVPTEPPTCCIVLTVAEATPASVPSTPSVAVFIAGDITSPIPTPITSRAGSTPAA